jgi:predicted transcriptional regulator
MSYTPRKYFYGINNTGVKMKTSDLKVLEKWLLLMRERDLSYSEVTVFVGWLTDSPSFSVSPAALAKRLKMPYTRVCKCLRSLVSKGFLVEKTDNVLATKGGRQAVKSYSLPGEYPYEFEEVKMNPLPMEEVDVAELKIKEQCLIQAIRDEKSTDKLLEEYISLGGTKASAFRALEASLSDPKVYWMLGKYTTLLEQMFKVSDHGWQTIAKPGLMMDLPNSMVEWAYHTFTHVDKDNNRTGLYKLKTGKLAGIRAYNTDIQSDEKLEVVFVVDSPDEALSHPEFLGWKSFRQT